MALIITLLCCQELVGGQIQGFNFEIWCKKVNIVLQNNGVWTRNLMATPTEKACAGSTDTVLYTIGVTRY